MAKNNTQLQQDVLEELEFEPCVDASEIGVTAQDGSVSLAGTVRSYAEKSAAVRAAERVSGARAVTDEIKWTYRPSINATMKILPAPRCMRWSGMSGYPRDSSKWRWTRPGSR